MLRVHRSHVPLRFYATQASEVCTPVIAGTRLRFVQPWFSGLDRMCWVAAIAAACGAVVSALLLRPQSMSSALEASAEHEAALRRAA